MTERSRETFQERADRTRVGEGDIGALKPVVEYAFEVLVEQLAAEHAVVYNDTYTMVPDNETRLRAATVILELYETRGTTVTLFQRRSRPAQQPATKQ